MVSINKNVDLIQKRSFDFQKEKESSKNNASGLKDLKYYFSKIFSFSKSKDPFQRRSTFKKD